MFVGITNTPRDYAWGSRTAIAELLGRRPSGGPEAELWLGAHPAWPSVVTDATPAFAGRALDAVIAEDPARFLGPGRTTLPFLLKVLAADQPLSLQVHPNPAQAQAGFARENEAGLAVDAPERNYRDASAKPELLLALSPSFEALAGFQHVSTLRLLIEELIVVASGDDRDALRAFADRLATGDPALAGSTGSAHDVAALDPPASPTTTPAHTGGGNPLHETVAWLLHAGDDVAALVGAVIRAAAASPAGSSFQREFATVGRLAALHPGDPGVVLSLLLNRISLSRGQALFLRAGSIHAYLEGLGIELMASSDNVLRGGLTSKHVDVDELLDVVVFESTPPPIVQPDSPVEGVDVFRTDGDDFVLAQIALGDAAAVHGYRLAGPDSATFALTGPAIVLVVSGGLRIDGATDRVNLARGDAALITPDEGALTFSGSGVAYLATTP
ncbi:MAG TPA: mannose-6-phosphate isomerase, class I [Amnibacterium sp.]|nr:mannose-6-phosphate isomerase, class I [Amnibacterium sp.]